MTATIKTKRIYDPPARDDGVRILVDRLWPRGMAKADAEVVYWAKDIAPSNDLRKWYNHEPDKWKEFRKRYFKELDGNPDGMRELMQHTQAPLVTFLFSSKETDLNNASVLKDYVQGRKA
ncbi:MAG TPA: DUF488 family protein [Burkholderiaceae bacterium]|nr:DUF488 family protein [Burkholderiaceae bacterium]